jgi:tetratricopeptide (TPR) repeat protein
VRLRTREGIGLRWFDVVLVAAVATMLVFPLACRLAADGQPSTPEPQTRLAAFVAHRSPRGIDAIPAFVALTRAQVRSIVGGGPAAEVREIQTLSRQLFGHRVGDLLVHAAERAGSAVPRLRGLPDGELGLENDLAGLLIIAGAEYTVRGHASAVDGNAGLVALTLLRQATRARACAPRLNLAFLLSADAYGQRDQDVAAQYAAAGELCPGDPTPLWALAQYRSELATPDDPGSIALALETSHRLQRAFPGVGAAWATEADTEMRVGYALQVAQPFAARRRYGLALALYQRAATLAPGPDIWAGLARARAALGQPAAAVAEQERAVAAAPGSAALQARLLDYLQRAHRFATAAVVAMRFASVHRWPDGEQLYAVPAGTNEESEEDAGDPLSTGAVGAAPIDIAIGSHPTTAPGIVVTDLGFLPAFRPMQGIDGRARWCPGWLRRVDLLLSSRPAAALEGFSTAIVDLRQPRVGPGLAATVPDCQAASLLLGDPSDIDPHALTHGGPGLLAAVAELELGHMAAARRWAATAGASLADVEDLRQNLWRYAGDLGHAASAAAQWSEALPNDELAILREGEIAFLRGRYDDAAQEFAVAAGRAALHHGSPSQDEAQALLDRGAALVHAGRRAAGISALTDAGREADFSRASSPWAAFISLYAAEQTGDSLLTTPQVSDATDAYAVAADAAAQIGGAQLGPQFAVRLEALDNNRAVAEVRAGDPGAAAILAARAVRLDPGNPIFWSTLGWARQHLHDPVGAIADYRAALARDPSAYPVGNDLGVLLMQRGDNGRAAAVLRHAVGANHEYATGWFNLGVALSRLGPSHLLAAQGSFARARELDASLGSRAPQPLFDDVLYSAHLDLSRPVPADWRFAQTQKKTPLAAAGVSALVLLMVGLTRSLLPRAVPGGAQRWIGMIETLDKRTKRVPGLHAPVVAIIATVGFLLWPLRSGPTAGWMSTLAFVAGLLTLSAVVIRVRQITAQHEQLRMHQETWPPNLAFGLVTTLVGFGWAPLPVVKSRSKAIVVHWAGPVAVALLALALLLLAAWLQVPLTRSLGAAGLVMAASLLTPVTPLDGASIGETVAGAVPAVAVLGTSVLVVAGVL